MYAVTGGSGFIGSNIAAHLEASGKDVVVVDWMGSNDFKWRNIAKRRLLDIVAPEEGLAFLRANAASLEGIFHMGAISTTTETDVDAIVRNNIRLSIDLWTLCSEQGIPLVYASSAATYGDGSQEFEDRFDDAYLSTLRPLNPYGWSKHAFDRYVQKTVEEGRPSPPRWAGLKFFNVYGPNEYHKGSQRSVAVQLFEQIVANGGVKLFRSDNPAYRDGEQLRDFVWVGDCASVALWLMTAPDAPSGLFNVGSGQARSFRDMAEIMFAALGRAPRIEFVDLPAVLSGKYQYFTQASMAKLRGAGYAAALTSLEDGLGQYARLLGSPDPYL